MKLNVMVRKHSEYLGTTYTDVTIDEDDIRKLAEEKAKEEVSNPENSTFEAQEIEFSGVV